jgi:chemotaxis protein methyltransferase CheR
MDMILTTNEFQQIQSLLYQKAGITLSEQKQTLIVSRLSKRIRQLGLTSFQAYYDLVVNGVDSGELTQMLDLLSTNKTDFFREPVHFDFLKTEIVPTLSQSKHIRIWSSASSSGEEPYSIAMTLLDAVADPRQWNCKILASDLSTRVLAKAARGVYEDERIVNLSPEMVKRHFLRGTGEQKGYVKVKPQVSEMVMYRRMNLMDESFPIRSPLDVLFCRNVMIYFDRPTQAKLMAKFHRYLKPGGYLFIGHSESLQWIDHPFAYVAPTIYQKSV